MNYSILVISIVKIYSFTASDGSEGSTAGRVVSPCSIMMHHGFRSKEARRAGSKNTDYAKQHHTPHCWLPAKVMYPQTQPSVSLG